MKREGLIDKIRKAIQESRKGKVFIESGYSNLELRILARLKDLRPD